MGYFTTFFVFLSIRTAPGITAISLDMIGSTAFACKYYFREEDNHNLDDGFEHIL